LSSLTSGDLRLGLQALGLRAGATVLIHCAMRRIGPLEKGPQTLLEAVLSVIGPGGTVVVPSGTANNSTTSPVFQAATEGMDAAQIAAFEAAMPGFDRRHTPSFGMGAFAEFVRTRPAAVRSCHPQTSFAAIGPLAGKLTVTHKLECHLGEESPLAALYAVDAVTLLIGVGYESCTTLHLAEYRRARPPAAAWHRCFVMADGRRQQHDFLAPKLDPACFTDLGADLDKTGLVTCATVGAAGSRLMPIRQSVDFAVQWMDNHQAY
jgi:aminoglycoside 3-N-acetyltransferase